MARLLKYIKTFSPIPEAMNWGFGIGDPKGFWSSDLLLKAILEFQNNNWRMLNTIVWKYL